MFRNEMRRVERVNQSSFCANPKGPHSSLEKRPQGGFNGIYLCASRSTGGASQRFGLHGSRDIKKRIPAWAALSLGEVVLAFPGSR